MEDILQYVEADHTKLNQQVKFPKKKSWWKVIDKSNGNQETPITLLKGQNTIRVNPTYKLLQKPFDNM
ncbi:MAG: hypothetical protein U5K27_04755 [Desulfotignum sp.]|nr:hypothetical protein [Desulfotignum sp.]